jgi:hypothetical protein
MSAISALSKLKEKQKKIKEILEELKKQETEVENELSSQLQKEKKIHEELRKCRDMYLYSRLEMRLSSTSRKRKIVDEKKQAILRKIRGHEEEFEKTRKRIKYMKPKGELVSHKKL